MFSKSIKTVVGKRISPFCKKPPFFFWGVSHIEKTKILCYLIDTEVIPMYM